MSNNDIERSATQAVCLYEELVKVNAHKQEIRSAYATAKDLTDYYGEYLDSLWIDSLWNNGEYPDYSLYYNLRSRLDLTHGEFINLFA